MNKDIEAYLIHSYLYYGLNQSVISDNEYDTLCKKLLDSEVEHPLVSKENLTAGTGFSIKEYPGEIVEKAEKLLREAPAAIIDDHRRPFKLSLSYTPMETWLLLGMYIDYGYVRQREIQEIIREELQRRWTEGYHRSTFYSYFKDHQVTLGRFGLK